MDSGTPSHVYYVQLEQSKGSQNNNPQLCPLQIVNNELVQELFLPLLQPNVESLPVQGVIDSQKNQSKVRRKADSKVISKVPFQTLNYVQNPEETSASHCRPLVAAVASIDNKHILNKIIAPAPPIKKSSYIQIYTDETDGYQKKLIQNFTKHKAEQISIPNYKQFLTTSSISQMIPAHNQTQVKTDMLSQTSTNAQIDLGKIKQENAPGVSRVTELSNSNELGEQNIAQSKRAGFKKKIKNYVHISDAKVPPRAVAVLPDALRFRYKLVYPRRTLSARVRFGPVQGIHCTTMRTQANKLLSNATIPVFLLNQDKDYVTLIDVSDQDKSNWIGLLPLGDQATANLWLYEESDELYVITTQSIGPRTPLRIGYSKKYAEDHHIPLGPPTLDLDTVNSVQWWCNECNRTLPSASLLLRHEKLYHKDEINKALRRNRCPFCKRTFSRIFTLKRHKLTCLKKPNQATGNSQGQSTESNTATDIISTLNNEDNRIPSDESFQNFSSGLDFSTNLFDTDRISSLDISGHSIGFRDESRLSNDLGFTALPSAPETDNASCRTDASEKKSKSLLDSCAYCNQVVVKEKKNKHLRVCPSRLTCECGRIFRHKQSLAEHIQKFHRKDQSPKTDKKQPEDEKPYNCEECSLNFKRRGMLVNHLWRIHKTVSTTPVEMRVRHYPCVACSKIYRSAAKRDRHVRVHHPGAEKLRGQSIEGGIKTIQPASCSECPRQYSSRAKLLQHIRAQHLHLAKHISAKMPSKHSDEKNNETTDQQTPSLQHQPVHI